MVEESKMPKEEVAEAKQAIKEVKEEVKKQRKGKKIQVSGVTVRDGVKVATFRIETNGKNSYEVLPV